MTYNFDPEAWLERQLAVLDARRGRSEIDDEAQASEREELHRRYDAMVSRLEGTYEIPSNPSRPPND